MFTTVASVCLPAGFASPIWGWEWQHTHSAYSINEQRKHVNCSRLPVEAWTSDSGSLLNQRWLKCKQARRTIWCSTNTWEKSDYAPIGRWNRKLGKTPGTATTKKVWVCADVDFGFESLHQGGGRAVSFVDHMFKRVKLLLQDAALSG